MDSTDQSQLVPAAAILGAIVAITLSFVGGCVALFNSWRSRVVARSTRIAEFRQQWISELRDTTASLQGALVTRLEQAENTDNRNNAEVMRFGSKILLMINPHEEEHAQVKSALDKVHTGERSDALKAMEKFNDAIHCIEKREWKRLKHDLQKGII